MRLLIAALFLLLLTGETAARITERIHPSLPSPLRFVVSDLPRINLSTIATPSVLVRGYVMWLPGCFFTGVAFTTMLRRRELGLREAWEIAGSCVVPVLGGMVMRRLFELHPEWSRLPLPPRWIKDLSIASQS